jgi:ankyrin repeat protein
MKRIMLSVLAVSFLCLSPLRAETMDIDMGMGETLKKEAQKSKSMDVQKENVNISAQQKEKLKKQGELEAQLFMAAAAGYDEDAKDLLERQKVNVNAQDENMNTPLLVAKDLDMVKLLLAHGADINAQNKDGIARLHIDVFLGHFAIAEYLLNQQINADIQTKNGVAPLHLVVQVHYFGDPNATFNQIKEESGAKASTDADAIVKLQVFADQLVKLKSFVIEHLPGVGASGILGGVVVKKLVTAAALYVPPAAAMSAGVLAGLGVADMAYRNLMLGNILQKAKNPNIQDINGYTPLHTLAAGPVLSLKIRQGGVVMAGQLLAKGAAPSLFILNKDGQTPYDIAKKYDRVALAIVLEPGNKSVPDRLKNAFELIKESTPRQFERIKKLIETFWHGLFNK